MPGGETSGEAAGASVVSQDGVPDGSVAVEVEVGLINEDYVEILSGLEEGDEVYLDTSAMAADSGAAVMGGGSAGGGFMDGMMGGGFMGGGSMGGGSMGGGGRGGMGGGF